MYRSATGTGSASGAQIVTSQAVTEITPQRDGTVVVETPAGSYSAAKVIVTAGPWIGKLLGHDYADNFRVFRQMLCWFEVSRNSAQYTPERFPIFIWIAGDQPRDMIYGFPAIDGPTGGIKIATEQYDRRSTPTLFPARSILPKWRRSMTSTSRPAFPMSAADACAQPHACTRSRRMRSSSSTISKIGRTVLIASACSGHGFKHSAALGEALAQMAMGERSSGRPEFVQDEPIQCQLNWLLKSYPPAMSGHSFARADEKNPSKIVIPTEGFSLSGGICGCSTVRRG